VKNSIWLLLLISWPSFAAEGDLFGELFARPGRKTGPRLSYDLRQYETQNQKNDSHKQGLRRHEAEFSLPLSRLTDRRWKLSVDGGLEESRTNARFPNGRLMPSKLWHSTNSLSYFRMLDGDKALGGSFTVGSNSDAPYSQFRDFVFQANAIYRSPSDLDSGWIYFLNFSNNRNFLNYIPVPGFAYYFKASSSLRMTLGIPFLMAVWTPFEKAALSFTYFPVHHAQLKFSYFIFGPVHAFLQAKHESKNYLLDNRPATKERLLREEGTFLAGISTPLEDYLVMEASAGYSVDRKYFLGEDFSDKDQGQILRFKSAPFAQLKLNAVF
jgi:hypothetical protein